MKRHKHHWTAEDHEWMIATNQRCDTYSQIVGEYNATHDDPLTEQAVKTYFKIRKIARPYNTGKFNSSRRPRELPIGTIRKAQTATFIKISNIVKNGTGYQRPDWIPLQEYVWRQAGREVPEGKMIMFLDGNTNNYSLDNLYPVNRAILATMARNQWYKKGDPMFTKTAIKWCELRGTIKENT